MSIVRRAALLVLLCSVSGCESSSNGPSADAVFQVRACTDQTFNIRVTGSELVSRAENLVGQAQQPIVTGRVARGSGGFNQPYSWHLLPETLEFADMTIEFCDGCPQMVEANLDYWVDTVGRFCPWTSQIVRRIR